MTTIALDILCLIIWFWFFIEGVIDCAKGKSVDKVGYIGALIVCILHFTLRIIAQVNY